MIFNRSKLAASLASSFILLSMASLSQAGPSSMSLEWQKQFANLARQPESFTTDKQGNTFIAGLSSLGSSGTNQFTLQKTTAEGKSSHSETVTFESDTRVATTPLAARDGYVYVFLWLGKNEINPTK